jgi:hypothetical protein
MLEPEQELDVTNRLVAAIAEELWRLYGGNDQLNWVEAEAHLRRIIDGAGDAAQSARDVIEAGGTSQCCSKPFTDDSDADGAWGVGSAIRALTNAA